MGIEGLKLEEPSRFSALCDLAQTLHTRFTDKNMPDEPCVMVKKDPP